MRQSRIRRRLKIVFAGLLTVLAVTYLTDRFWLSPPCAPCHSDLTAKLPVFGSATTDGIVRIAAQGLEFRARVAGFSNTDGEGVILLHGFPETSITWRPVIAKLAREGYRVVAFDQRGYSPAARPGSISSYTIDALVGDVMDVARKVGFDRFHLIGHDWGGNVGWHAAARHPDKVSTLTSLSMPHPDAFAEALGYGTDQLKRSSYAAFVWLPWLPEFVYGYNRAAYLRRNSWRDKPPEQRVEYSTVFTEPGALSGILNWYRANSFFDLDSVGRINQPTLFIWGNRDKALGRVGAEKTSDYVDGPFQMLKLWAGHSLMNETADPVAVATLRHLKQWPLSRKPSLPAKLPLPPHLRNARCVPSKPHCLRVNVRPQGDLIHIENRCKKRFAGTVRLKCSKWQQDAKHEYYFDLKPGSTIRNEFLGLDYGNCYYDQIVCAPE